MGPSVQDGIRSHRSRPAWREAQGTDAAGIGAALEAGAGARCSLRANRGTALQASRFLLRIPPASWNEAQKPAFQTLVVPPRSNPPGASALTRAVMHGLPAYGRALPLAIHPPGAFETAPGPAIPPPRSGDKP